MLINFELIIRIIIVIDEVVFEISLDKVNTNFVFWLEDSIL